MAEEELQVIRLRNDFYRDGFHKSVFALSFVIFAVLLLIGISLYIHLNKPKPVTFVSDNEWRVLPPVPVDVPYLQTQDLLQWVSEALPAVFNYDFIDYMQELQENQKYFTTKGWQAYVGQLNTVAGYNTIYDGKIFASAVPSGAPFIENQGVLDGRYVWWVQMPVTVQLQSYTTSSTIALVIKVLVVRIPTLNNIYGVSIENFIMTKSGAITQ